MIITAGRGEVTAERLMSAVEALRERVVDYLARLDEQPEAVAADLWRLARETR